MAATLRRLGGGLPTHVIRFRSPTIDASMLNRPSCSISLGLTIDKHQPTMRLLLFSGSQSPLAVRYPHPKDPKLVLPPLVHRALHTALDTKPPSAALNSHTNTLIIPKPEALNKHTPAEYEQEDFEVTVKIQLRREQSTQEYLESIRSALEILSTRKGLSTPDVVLVGLPEGTCKGKERSVSD